LVSFVCFCATSVIKARISKPGKAALLLLGATVFWGTSFILTKALADIQRQQAPAANTWLLASLSLVIRFGGGALLTGLWNAGRLRHLTRLELWQGAGLGVFGGVGILLQMDGVMHTEASTCAFLTQCYCVFIPVFLVWRRRRWPAKALALSCAMVLLGVATLSNVNWGQFRIGRGEWETIVSSIFFTAQILWLDRRAFAGNESRRMTVVMFAVTALVVAPALLASGAGPRQWLALYASPAAIGIIIFLTLACTVAAYGIMNEWQPHVPATEAGLIYCCEPLFTAVFALFLPGWLAQWASVPYANEHLNGRLLVGGGLITGANLLALLRKNAPAPAD
jgi:drug/metabolite transporter (DMT)-like permease